MNCVDCVSWNGSCSKGKLGVTALSSPCDDFKQRPMQSGIAKPKNMPKPRTHLNRFGRQECQGCNYKGSSYCWRNCPYNIWKVTDY